MKTPQMETLLFLILAILPHLALASCAKPAFADPSRVNLTGDSVMIVTHATSKYDARLASKRGVEEAIRFARREHIPLVYLADNAAGSAENYFIDDCNPDYWVYSEAGEIKFDMRASHLYLVGGHLEVCLSNTLLDAMDKWTRQPRQNLTVTYFMDGIYSNGKDIEKSDAYHKDYMSFINVVTYGRPGGEQWPKLTLLETMGLIVNEKRQYEYLERILPYYPKTVPADYRVELKVNDDATKVLQSGRGTRPPVIRFNFIDSALKPAEQAMFRQSAD